MHPNQLYLLVAVVFCVQVSAQSPAIKITSPASGTIVTPGQTINVTISPVGATVINKAIAWILPLRQVPQVLQSAPYQTSVQVPTGQIGSLTIIALASDLQGNSLEDSVSVIVAPASAATSIKVNPNRLPFSSADGQVRSLSVSANFQDGSTAYVEHSPDIVYQSSNTNVAIVNSVGEVQAVAPGTTDILVSYSGFNATIPVTVGVPSMIVGASVAGVTVSVDGVAFTSAQAFSWTSGSTHTLAVTSPQAAAGATQFVFTSWSDGGTASHIVVAPSTATTFTANFKTQYQLTTSATTGGTVAPASGFYDAGPVTVAATPAPKYTFAWFSGALTGTKNPQTLVLSAPASVNASFNASDTTKPTSHVLPLAPTQNTPSFTLQWSGTDVGSGIQDFTIYVSDNGAPFVQWQTQTTITQATFTGIAGHTYGFYSMARDLTGKIESAKTTAEATTTVGQSSCATDATPQLKISRSGFRFNNSTGRFVQTVTLQQLTLIPIQLPLSLVLDNLGSNATLFNKAGVTGCAVPAGSPYINLPTGSTSVILDFANPSKAGITYNARVLMGTSAR